LGDGDVAGIPSMSGAVAHADSAESNARYAPRKIRADVPINSEYAVVTEYVVHELTGLTLTRAVASLAASC
jgi:hypothetical protein